MCVANMHLFLRQFFTAVVLARDGRRSSTGFKFSADEKYPSICQDYGRTHFILNLLYIQVHSTNFNTEFSIIVYILYDCRCTYHIGHTKVKFRIFCVICIVCLHTRKRKFVDYIITNLVSECTTYMDVLVRKYRR